jgi:hypothetical protein
MGCNRPSLPFCTYVPAPVEQLTPIRFMSREATGKCTFEVSPQLQINNTTFTVHKLFIYSEAKYYNFLYKHGVIWPFLILSNLTIESEGLLNL